MPFQTGERVGDYEITGILGAGGMGQVYKVRNVLSDRTEAMKVLLPALTANKEIAERFLREIRVLASFDHPHIAALRTAQQTGDQILMVMEYIEGFSLDALLKRGHLALGPALNFCAQVLDALQYAHERGVVHRDLKPSNVMVTKSGAVKLMDFGIAKLAADPKLTSTGTTFGSLLYMSPEQIQGAANVDARSDLYSLGICLYEMVTGKPPFDADSEYSLMSAHLNQAPRPPIQVDPAVPQALNQLILKSLLKDPAYRFQSAAEMLGELNRVRSELGLHEATDTKTLSPVLTPPLPPLPEPVRAAAPKNRRMWYIAAGSLATVAVLVATLLVVPYLSRTSATTTRVEPKPVAKPVDVSPAVVTKPADPVPDPAVASQPVTPTTRPATKTTAAAGQRQQREPEPAGVKPPSAPVAAAVPQTAQPQPAQQLPPQQPPPQQQQQTAAQQPPAQPAPRTAELNQVREQYNQLAIRTSTAKAGLQSLQSQMGGLGLRADMREAAARADYLMQEAMSSIRAGDIESARRNIDMADRTVEKLEKFLGR